MRRTQFVRRPRDNAEVQLAADDVVADTARAQAELRSGAPHRLVLGDVPAVYHARRPAPLSHEDSVTAETRTHRVAEQLPPLRKVRTVVPGERQRLRALVEEGRRSGPLTAYRKVARKEVDAPFFEKVASLTWLPRTGSRADAWVDLALRTVAVPVCLLVATNASSRAPVSVQLAIVGVFTAMTLVVSAELYLLVFGRNQPNLMQQLAGWSLANKAYWIAMIVIVPTVGFATVTAFGVHHRLFGLTDAHSETRGLSFAAFETYLWHLAHAVPLLDIPQTLKWKARLDFREWYGGNLLILMYKVALIVPLLQLLSLLIKRPEADGASAHGEPQQT